MTTKINASTAGLTETVDTSGILEIQTANTAAVIIDASQNANFVSTGAITVPVGTTAQRPTGVNGMIRYNSNTAVFEFFANNTWTAANVTPPAVISVAPVISGSPVVGQNLTSTTGTWTGSVSGYYYQWLANSTAISNATANVFTLTSTQNNTNITCNVTAYNAAGNSTPSTSNSLGPVTSTYLINNSLRFRSSASANLSRTPATAGNRQTWTWSGWVKRGTFGGYQTLFCAGTSASTEITFDSSTNSLDIGLWNGSSYIGRKLTSAVYRDPSAWYHVVAVMDTTNATADNRILLYVNGVQVTSFAESTNPSQNTNTEVNNTVVHNIADHSNANYYFDGYLANVQFVDGQALTPSSFGQTDATTGAWVPIAYSGTYGTNGFFLPFSNTTSTTTLGYDSSGNANNWTPNNISLTAGVTYDSMTDVPTLTSANVSNYSVYNRIGNGGGTITNGNMRSSTSSTTPDVGSMAMVSGKWYWEVTVTTSSNPRVGIYDIGSAAPTNLGATAYGWAIINSPSRIYYNGSTTAYGSFNGSNGDVVMIAYDADAGKLWFGANNSWFASGNPASGTNPSATSVTGRAIVAAVASGTGSNVFDINFGQQPFNYTPPSGFLALNAYNL